MVTKTQLQALINANVSTNGSGDITGSVLNDVLLQMIDDAYEYTEVNVSASDLLIIGTNKKTILPALPSGQYYEYRGLLEWNHSGSVLELTDNFFIGEWINYSGTLFGAIHLSPFNQIIEFSSLTKQIGTVFQNATTPLPENDVVSYGQRNSGNEIIMTTWYENNPTGGDFTGNALIKIWYKIRTVGTEL